MDVETLIQTEREKQIPCNNACMWNLENGTEDLTCKTEIKTQM